jgi:hypothetical protein
MTCQPLTWMREVRDDPDVGGSSQHVLLVLALRMDGSSGTGWVSQQTLASDTGCSTRTVERAISVALKLGYLKRLRRGHRLGNGAAAASTYALSTRHPCRLEISQPAKTGSQPAKTGVSTRHQGGSKGSSLRGPLQEARRHSHDRWERKPAAPTEGQTVTDPEALPW